MLQQLFVRKGHEAHAQLVAGNQFFQWLIDVIQKNREGISKMSVTHCDRRASMFLVEELEPFEGWSHGSFCVHLRAGMYDCGLFQSLHFSCRHALASYAVASVKWGLYVHLVYM
ncbi:hypothetical protein Ahy_A05g022382 [Arachis hypogaea]|uniref:SWIM-type domain-containing protein n=1 Tax=Arachis hypogaea TaxID=3818 RepID=A0A445D0K5_ARAHY|nr:hypothetical protein Ahy_A05g022382 [Arachis hypogaea]